jgi:hypothetical protein
MVDWCEKSQVYFSDLHRYIRRYSRPHVAFCHAWVDVMNAMDKFCVEHPNNTIAVRYEDLVAEPTREMQRIFEFVGESWEPTLIGQALEQRESKGFSDWKTFGRSAIEADSVGRWRRLPAATVADLAPIVNPVLVQNNYDPVEIEHVDAETLQRRYELGLLFQSLKRKTANSGDSGN